jgi:lactate/malate dehydrogenase, NAD binding domain
MQLGAITSRALITSFSCITLIKKLKIYASRHFNFQNNAKVAVCGASGGIGQPLSLLLKQSPLVTQLSLFDIVNTPGVAADLSHIDSRAPVKGFNGPDELRVRKNYCHYRFATRLCPLNYLFLESSAGHGHCHHPCWCAQETWHDP